MLTIRRILFPTDFSEGAARAFPQAAILAEQHDAELHVVNVTGPHSESETTLPVSGDTLTEWIGPAISKDGLDLSALTIVQNQVDAAAAPEGITAYVEDQAIDLVVMGTHGRRGVRRMLLGSVTEEVVRTATCPVLTVRSDTTASAGRAVRRILVPVDFSDASQLAVRHAAELAVTYEAQIDLLHVVEQVAYPSAYGVDPGYFSPEEILPRVETTLGKIAREEVASDQVQVSATVGYAPLTILDYIDDNDVDLVVIATHGRTGLDRMLLGSVAERVIRRSSAPVFVVKPEQKSLLSPSRPETTNET